MENRMQEIEELKATGKLVFCTKCGAPNSKDDDFCGECGARLVTTNADNTRDANQSYYQAGTYQQEAGTSTGELNPTVVQMIGQNQEYYVNKFQIMKATGGKASWNWPAFLVTPFWLFYRRMYLYGGIYLGASLILSALNLAVLVFAADIAAGILGNYLYMTFLEKTLSDANHLQEPLRQQTIASHTGTNTTAVWICVGAYVGISLIFALIIGGSIGLLYELM